MLKYIYSCHIDVLVIISRHKTTCQWMIFEWQKSRMSAGHPLYSFASGETDCYYSEK